MKVLITGANGFIGKAICQALLDAGYSVRGLIRQQALLPFSQHLHFEMISVGDINAVIDWSAVLQNIDVIIHTAARVHIMQDNAADPLAAYREINTEGTLKLAQAAIQANVKKIIFLSSVKVNGEMTQDKPFSENNIPHPDDPYAVSKWEAEQGIIKLCHASTMGYTIVRLPLVYGVGVKANFAKLIQLVKSKIPLPMKSIKNKRSMLYIGNLTSALLAVLQHPQAIDQTYLLSDNDDISTPELITKIALAYNTKVPLFPCPLFLFKLLGLLTGKKVAVTRLLGSLQIDSSKIRVELNWQPPYTLASGLAEMVAAEREHK